MSDLITDICTAIDAKHDAAGTKLTDGLYLEETAQNKTGDYGVFRYDGGSIEHEVIGTADSNIEVSTITFDLFSDADDGATTITAMYDTLTDIFDWATFSMTETTLIKMQRTITSAMTYVDNIWQVSVTYELGTVIT